MADIQQNTLYLTTHGSYVARDHLTLQVEVPVYPDDLPREERCRERAVDWRKLSIPIHMLESVCVFGASSLSPPALDLCWEHGVAVNYLSEGGYLVARMTGVADTSVLLRRAQFRAADDAGKCAAIARQVIAGKLQNSRNSLLRGARETDVPDERSRLTEATDALARQIHELGRWSPEDLRQAGALDRLRGAEGLGAATYFGVFSALLKQQREDFAFAARTRRPPRDRINCLLSFLYALVRHDCIAALTSIGLDPFVGFLHAERPNRPALALDLMEEFRAWLADRLAVTLVNRQQVGPEHFRAREGGAVEFTDAGRKLVITAYQQRKQEKLTHPLLDQELRIAQFPFVQARILARYLRGDIPDYVPFVPK
ncbi:MAG: type I-C CRISPR-associated endonuclease Cas1c [Verrucomicrobiota bacterium]